jgi:myo-inositol-1(or 4)-monophosphatase
MLNIAIKAARAAGSIINRAALDIERLKVNEKGANDFVTEVDHASEAAIIDTILAAYPQHGILGEETGRTRGNSKSEFLWIIDPLDGTTNFIHGLPIYAVSIALEFRGRIEQAVVYDPARNDLFVASKGRGAFLNDRRLRVSKRVRLEQALVGTGFPFRRGDDFGRYMRMFEELMQQCAGLRRPGAAALDLCYVAAGWYDGFFEPGLQPWDVAAGSLIVTEAGGLVGNFTGEADFLYRRETVAGAPKIYGQLVKILAPYSRANESDASAAESAPETAPEPTPEEALARAIGAPAAAPAPQRVRAKAARPTSE